MDVTYGVGVGGVVVWLQIYFTYIDGRNLVIHFCQNPGLIKQCNQMPVKHNKMMDVIPTLLLIVLTMFGRSAGTQHGDRDIAVSGWYRMGEWHSKYVPFIRNIGFRKVFSSK